MNTRPWPAMTQIAPVNTGATNPAALQQALSTLNSLIRQFNDLMATAGNLQRQIERMITQLNLVTAHKETEDLLAGIVTVNGAGGYLAGTGTAGYMPVWDASQPYLSDSIVYDSGTAIQVAGRIEIGIGVDDTAYLKINPGDAADQVSQILFAGRDTLLYSVTVQKGNDVWNLGIDCQIDGSNRFEMNYDEAMVFRAPGSGVSPFFDFQTLNPGGVGNIQRFRIRADTSEIIFNNQVDIGIAASGESGTTLTVTPGITGQGTPDAQTFISPHAYFGPVDATPKGVRFEVRNAIGTTGVYMTSDDIAHGVTGTVATDVYFQHELHWSGGNVLRYLSDADFTPLTIHGIFGVTDPTDATPAIQLYASKRSGTSQTGLADAETVLTINNWGTTVLTIVGNGDHTVSGTLTAAHLKDSSLTSGRVAIVTTAGQLADDADLSFSGDVLTVVGGVKTAYIYPAADSTTAVQIKKADGSTGVVIVDTSNGRLGVNVTPTQDIDVNGAIRARSGIIYLA